MTLHAALLPERALGADENGATLDIGLNWYRSLPLSSVETLEVIVGGEAIPFPWNPSIFCDVTESATRQYQISSTVFRRNVPRIFAM
jgi:hypothetical protein